MLGINPQKNFMKFYAENFQTKMQSIFVNGAGGIRDSSRKPPVRSFHPRLRVARRILRRVILLQGIRLTNLKQHYVSNPTDTYICMEFTA